MNLLNRELSNRTNEKYPLIIENHEKADLNIRLPLLQAMALDNILQHIGNTHEGQVTELDIKLCGTLATFLEKSLDIVEKGFKEL